MTRKAPDCYDIYFNSTYLIQDYYNRKEYDSAYIVLDYWESKCGMNEIIMRTRILFAIEDNKFDEAMYDSSIIYFVAYYINLKSKGRSYIYDRYGRVEELPEFAGTYDVFTSKLAQSLLPKQIAGSIEEFFCKIYSDQNKDLKEIFVTNNEYSSSEFSRNYKKEIGKYLSKGDLHMSFSGGVWLPSGGLNNIGTHGTLGFQIGVSRKKTMFNLGVQFKFVNTPEQYTFVRNGQPDTTDYFFGGYIGADFDRQLIRYMNHRIDFSAGFGWDGFSNVEVDKEDDNPYNDDGHSINSPNLNFGFTYRYLFNEQHYLGITWKYHLLDYQNEGGTNMSGDCITISLVYGGFTNMHKYSTLRYLKYY